MKKQDFHESGDTYRTGSTNPPKSHRGLVAVLLILVILLASITTLLGMMNIKLFKLLEEKKNESLSFSSEQSEVSAAAFTAQEGIEAPALGLTGQEMESLYRSYNQWPQGVYITQVTPDSPADRADLRPGDILTDIDGCPITTQGELEEKIAGLAPGHTLKLTIFRDTEELTVTLTLSNES